MTDFKKELYILIQKIVELDGNCTDEEYNVILESVSKPFLIYLEDKMIEARREDNDDNNGISVISGMLNGNIDSACVMAWNFFHGGSFNRNFTTDLILSDDCGKKWLEINYPD